MILKFYAKNVLVVSMFCFALAASAQKHEKWYSKTTIVTAGGQTLDKIVINGPPSPPPGYDRPVWKPSGHGHMRGSLVLACVPAFDWSFGCSATSAAMLASFYDITGRHDIYTGPTNGGVMPLDNSCWPQVTINDETLSQCPLSATRDSLDGRTIYGHVDDYWISYMSPGPDPWVTGGWTEHEYDDCVGDYMFTNQWDEEFGYNYDGSTTFYFYTNGGKTRWSALSGLNDGGAGLRSFMIAKGYSVADEYNQYIEEEGLTYGFSYTDYMDQINNGRPVIIQLEGHTVLGTGYDDSEENEVLIHDTWDYLDHWMVWGEEYNGMQHYGVTVIELEDTTYEVLTVRNTTVDSCKSIGFTASDTIYGSSDSTDDFLYIKGICTMTSGHVIRLKPGFNAREGCEFQAVIDTTSSF